MADTPRVTVPEAIEALKHCVENEKAHWSLSEICDPCVDVPVKYLRAAVEALPAAPAPEGGAVDGPEDDELPGDFLARVGMDGVLWADGFRKMALKLGYSDMDEGWLISWFCNAVMAGYDHAQRRFDPALATRSDDKPEGGVVWFGVTGAADETEALAVALFDARCPGIRMTDEDLHYYRAAAQRAMQAVTDELDTPALATREEAPAEAGDDEWSALWKLADAASTGSWGVEDPMDHCLTIVANPEAPVYDWKWIATCDWPDEDNQLVTAREVKANAAFIAAANPAAIKRLIDALRAQPPASPSTLAELHAAERLIDQQAAEIRRLKAREDAQPVAWRGRISETSSVWDYRNFDMTGEIWSVVQPLYTHPAPDALRVAAIAFRDAVSADIPATGDRYAAWVAKARAARADLDAAVQAEQKGGAA